MPGVPQLVGERDDVVHGARIGDEDRAAPPDRQTRCNRPRCAGWGWGAASIQPRSAIMRAKSPSRDRSRRRPRAMNLDRLLERDAAVAARRGRRKQILRPQLLDAEPPGHQPQGPLTQPARLPGLLHQGIQGHPLDVALMAGEIQGIQGPHLATLARELQAPAVEGVEDGGDRLLLPFPAGADGVEGLFAQGPIRLESRLLASASPISRPSINEAESCPPDRCRGCPRRAARRCQGR